MLLSPVAHVVSEERAADGCRFAMTVVDKGERGVLVWAGHLDPGAEQKAADAITSKDYRVRQSLNFTSWHDIRAHFRSAPYTGLVAQLVASFKRKEHAPGMTPSWLSEDF
jgi:hypothetical protein